jgi:hypothetical protein
LPGQGLDQADVDIVMGPARSETQAPPLQPDDQAAAHDDVIDAEVVEAPMRTPMAEARAIDSDVTDAEFVEAEAAPRAQPDPLAPIMALSADEKVALFS